MSEKLPNTQVELQQILATERDKGFQEATAAANAAHDTDRRQWQKETNDKLELQRNELEARIAAAEVDRKNARLLSERILPLTAAKDKLDVAALVKLPNGQATYNEIRAAAKRGDSYAIQLLGFTPR
jgi:1,4-alpha-glucan branching enzyme